MITSSKGIDERVHASGESIKDERGRSPGILARRRRGERMDINENSEVYGRITRVINELKMARQSVTIFKVVELTGIDQFVVFQYFYDNGLLRGR
jgi:hypothetical protein